MKKLFFSGKERFRILKYRKDLEKVIKKLDVNARIDSYQVTIDSKDPFSEYITSKIIEAFAFGFSMGSALQLKDTNYSFNRFKVKDLTRDSRVSAAVSRLIGTKGRTKHVIQELSDCDIVIKDKEVGIIGLSNNVETTTQAIVSLIKGSKQSNIYGYLERNKARLKALEEENVEEFILKEAKKESKKEKKEKK